MWALPWSQLLVVLGAGLLLAALLWGRIRSRRRVQALVDAAREDGRRAAASDGSVR